MTAFIVPDLGSEGLRSNGVGAVIYGCGSTDGTVAFLPAVTNNVSVVVMGLGPDGDCTVLLDCPVCADIDGGELVWGYNT